MADTNIKYEYKPDEYLAPLDADQSLWERGKQ